MRGLTGQYEWRYAFMLPSFSGKRNEKDGSSIPTPSASRRLNGEGAGISIIGPDLIIIGNLVSNGQVQVDGEVQGDIHGSQVVIGEAARVTGSIISDEVVIRGTVTGSIRSRRIILQSESKVEGDLYHKSLAIEQGAYFEGKSRRVEDPLAGIQRPELPSASASAN